MLHLGHIAHAAALTAAGHLPRHDFSLLDSAQPPAALRYFPRFRKAKPWLLHIISIVIICRAMAENIGYMLNDIGRLMRRRFDEMCQDLGVTSAQWRALFAISRRPGLNQGMLAELLEVEPITTCRMVDRLEQAGLVERRPDPNDRRAWQLFLGQAAMPLLDRLQERSVEMRRRALKGLSEEEVEALTSQLEVIRNNLSGAGEQKEASNG